MENKLRHTRVEPRDLTYKKLEDITNSFSEEHEVGSGGYGKVYKGVLDDGTVIAIKKLLHKIEELDDKKFQEEFKNLMRVQHKNIVRLVAYCYEIRHIVAKRDNGDYILAQKHERALCFEYFQLGSLDKYLSDGSRVLEWYICYKIIKGISEGLDYLHNGSKDPICHLDIKPENILLDDNMMPKIADFGLSRHLLTTRTHITKANAGTPGYMPPEFINGGKISKKFDVFSLGVVIIYITAKFLGHSKSGEMSPQEYIENVHDNWKKRMQATWSCKLQEADSLEVHTCIEIALRCVQDDRSKRPTIREVIDKLNEIETVRKSLIAQSSECKFERLVIDPLELRFPFWLDRDVSCVLQLTNESDDVLVFIVKTNQSKYSTRPDRGIIPPRSKLYVVVATTLQGQESAPADTQCDDLFLVQNARVPAEDLAEDFEKMVVGKAVDEVRLPIVYVALPPPPPTVHATGVVYPNNPQLEAMAPQQARVTKSGPWGGIGGLAYYIDDELIPEPYRLLSVTIHHGVVVDSLEFSYVDRDGEEHVIKLGPSESLQRTSGTFSLFNGSQVITSLTFTTNQRVSHGPFGQGGGTPFTAPAESHGWCIVSFFGRAGIFLDALGVYARSDDKL